MDYYFILKKSMIFMGAAPRIVIFLKNHRFFVGATPRNGLLFYFKKINDFYGRYAPKWIIILF